VDEARTYFTKENGGYQTVIEEENRGGDPQQVRDEF
jgi:ribosomal protein L17